MVFKIESLKILRFDGYTAVANAEDVKKVNRFVFLGQIVVIDLGNKIASICYSVYDSIIC